MIKLLKYDWKRNGNSILAAFIILLLAQTALTTLGWAYSWDEIFLFVLTIMLYAVGGFLAFLMACQTFNSNIKAYSRRLLPLPSLYTILSPVILIITAQIVIGLLYVAHDMIFTQLFSEDSLLTVVRSHMSAVEIVSVVLGIVWGTISTTIVIFFAIASSHIVGGRGGTFIGIVVAVVMFTVIPWLEWLIFPNINASNESFGFFRLVSKETENGSTVIEVVPFELMQLGIVLFEVAVIVAMVYGIIYSMERKMKL